MISPLHVAYSLLAFLSLQESRQRELICSVPIGSDFLQGKHPIEAFIEQFDEYAWFLKCDDEIENYAQNVREIEALIQRAYECLIVESRKGNPDGLVDVILALEEWRDARRLAANLFRISGRGSPEFEIPFDELLVS